MDVQKPKARDRGATTGARIRFTSHILAQMGAAHKSLDALLPVLYLRGISQGDFQREALSIVCGKDAPNLSSGAVIARLTRANGKTNIATMAEARFIGAPIRLRLGGRRLFAGANGAAGRMHAGADRRERRRARRS